MIFMKHRNLEKAVVLSLILSTGVYGSAWAETTGSLWDGEKGVNKIVKNGDFTIDASLNPGDKGELAGAGPHGIIDVEKGDLTIDTDYNGVDVGYKKDAQMNIYAKNITITAGENGIFTDLQNLGSTVILGSEDRKIQNLTISSGGQGIDNKNGNVYIYGADNSVIDITSTGTSGTSGYQQSAISNTTRNGIVTVNGGTIKLTSDKDHGIYNTGGITTLNSKSVTINAEQNGIDNSFGNVYLNTNGDNVIYAENNGINNASSGTINVIASENYYANGWDGNLDNLGDSTYSNRLYGSRFGIYSKYDGITNVIADNNNYISDIETSDGSRNIVNVVSGNDNIIGKKVDEDGNIYESDSGIIVKLSNDSEINITSVKGETNIYGYTGINYLSNNKNSNVNVNSGTDINIFAHEKGISVGYGAKNKENIVSLVANGTNKVSVDGNEDTRSGLKSVSYSQITLDAKNNEVLLTGEGTGNAIESKGTDSKILLEADNYNTILANETATSTMYEIGMYGDKYAVNVQSGGNVDVKAGLANTVYGAVYATGKNSIVDISKLEQTGTTFSRNAAGDVNNFVRSAAVIEDAGDLQGKEVNGDEITGMDVVSALYAEEGASINLSGVNNIQTYYDDPSDTHTSERAVWAYKGADITIEGNTVISTSSYESSPNDMDIAIAAGTSTNINDPIDMANVNLKYENYNGAKSFIQGDILAAYGGEVNIAPNTANTRAVSDAGINITGNLLAGNDGKLDVDLGNGGILVGRADDYGDAALNNGHGSGDKENGFYNPAFSSEIVRNGTVNLTMGEGSQWYVNGQSWITSVDTSKAQNTLIDLVSANTNLNMDSHALTIGTLKGDTNFRMKLDGNRQYSDMLYIGNGNGTYNIELEEVVTVEDMYADSGEGFEFSGLRFATVGKGSNVDFNVTATDKGFNNIIYTVGKDVYGSNVSNHENNAYNNGDGTSLDKPGNAAVEDLLKDAEQAGAATINTNDIMLLANEPDTGENLDNNENHLNYKLIDMQTVRSDAGETMLNMSRANYSNAIYMDRLNKRLGEARYINDDPEEDEGMWVRVRHDRIGKDEAFRSQNTMYELGYDKRQECDNGKRRVGFAVDYMHGDTGYNDIAGKGEIDRYGLWLYDTWTGNKGHYVDYVAKWGHLQNDFEVYNSEGKVTGDYSNNVFSISAEYGRKKDMGNDWYFEPQAQLQLARVTGADYTTSQGTKVSVDGINSLIGRAGFRIGKDFGEEKQSTLYFKADVLHEFLGDQTIRALDGTTNGWQSVDYENQGTWYDIGIGYAAMLSQSTYAFIDLEQSFGNDNDDTYQINAGVRWTF